MATEFRADFIQQLIERLERSDDRAEVAALKRLEGEMKVRIHSQGAAADGSRIGPYRDPYYRAKRAEAGRQVAFKDLEFFGDLRRGYGTGQTTNGNALGFFQDRTRLIAEGQQRQTGKVIFSPSDTERENMMDVYQETLFGQ